MKSIKENMEIEYYHSIENLPVYNWDKYITSRDLKWFIKNGDGQNVIQNPISTGIEVTTLDEYFIAKNDEAFSLKLQKYAKIDNLKYSYNVVTSMIQRMMMSLDSEFLKMEPDIRYSFIKELNSFGFSIPENNSSEGDKKELLRIDFEKESIKDEIRMLENELIINGIDVTKDSFGVSFDIIANDWFKNKEKNQASLLSNNAILDSKKISVLKWIELTKNIK